VPPIPNPPVISSADTLAGPKGAVLAYTITGTNAPSSFGANNPPPGMLPNAATGVLTGVPNTAGVYDTTILVHNAGGSDAGTLNVTIKP
jgi:hypothetical protein